MYTTHICVHFYTLGQYGKYNMCAFVYKNIIYFYVIYYTVYE